MTECLGGPNETVTHGQVVCVPDASVSIRLPGGVIKLGVICVPQGVLPLENGVINGHVLAVL